jgi:hypothetical protein
MQNSQLRDCEKHHRYISYLVQYIFQLFLIRLHPTVLLKHGLELVHRLRQLVCEFRGVCPEGLHFLVKGQTFIRLGLQQLSDGILGVSAW